MKLTNSLRKSSKGMTLLELTVVILVLLSLISILFVGARAWKKGSDRSANIMNIRNTQQAMRGYQNMYSKQVGDNFGATELADYVKFPKNIGVSATDGVTYQAGSKIMPMGAKVTIADGATTPSASDEANIWLQVSALGKEGQTYGADYGATADW